MPGGIYRALLVGNSDFPEDPHNLQALKGPVNDLTLLHQALTDPERGLFEPPNVRLLPERTKRDVTTAMERFFRSASPDDTLLLYYSGHGKSDEYDSVFLCVRDTRTDLLTSTGISDSEIDGFMRSSSARAVVIILDCCYSGAFKGVAIPKALKGSGRFLITSSRRNEPSADAGQESDTSAFTKHLVEALRRGVDHNHDGYVSVSDVYEHVLETLRAETKQTPQRHFDRGAVGDIALARATTDDETQQSQDGGSGGPPILAVSPESIELRGVGPDEELGVEIVDVFNEGGGSLEWTPRATADWIHVAPFEGYCELTLTPHPGINRGSVHIKDRGRGGSRIVRVLVEVRETHAEPRLQVSPDELDFGLLSRGGRCPPRTLLIRNLGDGDLKSEASASSPWLRVHQADDVVTVEVDTSETGPLAGEVVVRSEGGLAVIPVRATIEERGVVSVEPLMVDFGRVIEGSSVTERISVTNRGSGGLDWEYGTTGDFFTVERDETGLIVTLAAPEGVHVGSIWIRGDGGEATVDVRADVALPVEPVEFVETRRRGRRPLVLVLLLALAAVVGTAAWLATRSSSPASNPSAGFALSLDSDHFTPGEFANVAVMGDQIWVVNKKGTDLIRVEPDDRKAIPVHHGTVHSMTVAGDTFWLVLDSGITHTVEALGRNGNVVHEPVELPAEPGSRRAAVFAGSVWVPTESGLYRLPLGPGPGHPYRVGPILHDMFLLTAVGAVYESGVNLAGQGVVARIDPNSCDEAKCRFTRARLENPGDLAATASLLWVADAASPDTLLTPLDPATLDPKGNPVRLGRGPAARLAVEQGALWVAIKTSHSPPTESIAPLRSDTGKALPTPLNDILRTGPGLPAKLVFSNDRFWILYVHNGDAGVGAVLVRRAA